MAVTAAVAWQHLVDSALVQFGVQKRAREETLSQHSARRKRVRQARGAQHCDCLDDSSDGQSRRAHRAVFCSAHGAAEDGASPWLSYEQLQTINASRGFQPLSEATSRRLEAEVAQQLCDGNIDRKVCVVTDSWIFRGDACLVTISELPLAAMQKALAPRQWATEAITTYYDCAEYDDRLAGILLSARGLEMSDVGDAHAWISREVLQTLQTLNARLFACDSVEAQPPPPRFAIADCFVAGAFAEVDEATQIERQAVGLVQTRGLVKVVYGGAGNVLQSHLLSWDNRHATIASRVPSVPSASDFKIVFAGPMTARQELALAKQHECDGGRVKRLEALLRRINPLYRDIQTDPDFRGVADPLGVFCTRVGGENGADSLVEAARWRQQTVTAPLENHERTVPADEASVVQSETVLIETGLNDPEDTRIARAIDAALGRTTYVARHSTAVLASNDPSYMERAFPHLLTFGTGGFSCARSHKYGRREIVLHYLNLSTSRFAEDPLFKLKMFDSLATQRVKNGLFVRVRQDPDTATRAMRVTPDELLAAKETRKRKRKAAKFGRLAPQPIDGGRCSASVLKSIYAGTSKMWCSNEERSAFERKVNAMTFMFGEPSVFWTLTPNPDASIAVAFWAGYDLPNGRPKDLVACTAVNMPSSAEMKRLAMQNTALQAHYYKLCCRALIDILFSWDSRVNRPKADPGLFGFVEALYYALEQQGRLRVHHHGVLWVAGLPRTTGEWDALLADGSMRARFEEYCASIFSAELPVFDALETIECPVSGCDGELAPVEINKKYKHRLRSGTPPPMVAKCGVCNAEFTEPEVADAVLERAWASLDAEQQVASSESAVRALGMRFGGLSAHRSTACVQLTRLLRKDQVHAYQHTFSCVKGRSGSKCRYHFFRDREDSSGLNDKGEMRYRRRVGNQWLNTFIPLWRRQLHFNMDARVLGGGHGGHQASRYAIQYATKQQTVLDNAAVVELAFRRRVQREVTSLAGKTEFEKGVGRLLSLAFASSGVMEVGGPLATATMFEDGPAKFSCDFERLGLTVALGVMNDEDVDVVVVARGRHLVTDTSVRRYMDRPQCLEACSWYDFCAWYKPTRSKSPQPGDACMFASDDLHELAAHVRAHGFTRVDYPRVPEIIGPRLPDARNLDDAEQADQAELYYRAAALLYCPFRHPKDFIDRHGSAKQHFAAWGPLGLPKVRRSLEFHQQYYIALDAASDFRAHETAEDADNSCDDADVHRDHAGPEDGSAGCVDSLVLVSSDAYVCAGDSLEEVDEDAAGLHSAAEDTAVQMLLSKNVLGVVLPEDTSGTLVVRPKPIEKTELAAFERQLLVAEPADSVGSPPRSSAEPTTEVIVELLNMAVADVAFRGAQSAQQEHEVAAFATVQDVSLSFGLNAEQHLAFVLVSVPLLHKIAGIDLPSESSFSSSPLIITGAGGTGKTRIVEAVQCLGRSWGRQTCVMATASSGIAAANLGGHTMHSSVNLGINQKHLPKHLLDPSDELLAQWDPVLCLFADELSMTEIGFFGLWEEALRKVKECSDPFGGLVTVLMFDFFQLETVCGSPLYKNANPHKPYSELQARGSMLYRSIDKVVYLTRNMRFEADPEWGEWLAQARLGRWCEDLRTFLRQVALPPADMLTGDFIQVVSTDNATRQQINDSAVQIASRSFRNTRKVYAIPAKLSSRADVAKIRRLGDNQTGNIPVFLKAYIGALPSWGCNLRCCGRY